MRFIAQILINALAIFLADYLLSGFIFEGNILTLLIAGLIMGLINFFIRPVLRLLAAPLIVISLGFFIIIINMGLLWLLEYLVPELTITGFWTYLWGVIIISSVNIIFSRVGKKKS